MADIDGVFFLQMKLFKEYDFFYFNVDFLRFLFVVVNMIKHNQIIFDLNSQCSW